MRDLLFQPIVINGMEVKNRIFMPAMHLNMCRNFEVSERLLAFYAERGRGGAGMITAGYASVDELSAHPAHIGAHSDAFIVITSYSIHYTKLYEGMNASLWAPMCAGCAESSSTEA